MTSLSLASHHGLGLLGVLGGLLLGLGGLVLGGGLLHGGLFGLLGGADGLLPLGLPYLGEGGSGRTTTFKVCTLNHQRLFRVTMNIWNMIKVRMWIDHQEPRSISTILTSGFWFLLAMMSWRVAPTTARWNFWARRVLFLVTSSSSPFLCFLEEGSLGNRREQVGMIS